MKTNELMKKINAYKLPELQKEISAAKKDLALKYLDVRAGKSDNYTLVSAKKREIARMLTVLNEKQGE